MEASQAPYLGLDVVQDRCNVLEGGRVVPVLVVLGLQFPPGGWRAELFRHAGERASPLLDASFWKLLEASRMGCGSRPTANVGATRRLGSS